MSWELEFSNRAEKDAVKIKNSIYGKKVTELLDILEKNPFQIPPPYEKLDPPTENSYSRRINEQHRLVYKIYKKERVVKILSMWTHYE
jgi:Txe/YoeB family toxin of toxin-antitoxin system